MNRFPWALVVLVVVGAVLSRVLPLGAESKNGTPVRVSAREKRVLPPQPAKVEVSRWKQVHAKEGSYGLVVEQEGNKVSAHLYKLDAGEGLLIREQESTGTWWTARKGLVLPLYNPPDIGAERWVKEGGPHLVVPWPVEGDRLTATLHQPGRGEPRTIQFSRLWYPSAGAGRNSGTP
jgi:hypothetical protein